MASAVLLLLFVFYVDNNPRNKTVRGSCESNRLLQESQFIVDLAQCVGADFAIMDAVIGMEGPGPASGDPRHIGQILASRNILSLDRIACRLVGYDPDAIDYLKKAVETGNWLKSGDEEELLGGNLDEAIIHDFKIVKEGYLPAFKKGLPPLARSFITAISKKPFFNHKICVRCGDCIKICPAKVLTLKGRDHASKNPGKIQIDRKGCIRCFCCHEVCPAKAIILKRF